MEFEEISRARKWEPQWNGLNQGKQQISLDWTKIGLNIGGNLEIKENRKITIDLG